MKTMIPDIACGIASISPILGCSGNCAYCYLCLKETKKPSINSFGIDRTIQYLQGNIEFIQGVCGTYICIGAWGEIFPKSRFRSESIRWINKLATLGNPIVLVTKGYLSNEEISILINSQKSPGQIVLLESITMLNKWKEIEPGTENPEKRFECLEQCQKSGLKSCALINPYIDFLVDKDFEKILTILKELSFKDLIISPLYINQTIYKQLSKNILFRHMLANFSKDETPNFSQLKSEHGIVTAVNQLEKRNDLFELSNKYQIKLWNHYTCFLSNHFHRLNPLRKEQPSICQNCGICASGEFNYIKD